MFFARAVSLLVFSFSLSLVVFSDVKTNVLPLDRFAFANQLAERHLYAEALLEYELVKGVKEIPQDELLFRMAEAYRALGRKTQAYKCYSDLLSSNPQSVYADYSRLNRALLGSGETRISDLKALNRQGVSNKIRATVLYYLGEIAQEAKNNKEALEYFNESIKLGGKEKVADLAMFKKGTVLSESSSPQDRRQAMFMYYQLADSNDRRLAQEALFFAAMISYREGNWREASMLFRRLAKDFPRSSRVKDAREFSTWAEYLSGQYSEALTMAAFLRDDGNEDGAYIVAASLRMLERLNDALVAYEYALEKYPRGKYADREWFERLTILSSLKKSQAVLDELAQKPNPPKETKDRAWRLGCEAAIAVTNFPLAVEFAKRVTSIDKSELAPSAMHRLAWLYDEMKMWDQSAETYRALADKWPNDKMAHQALFLAGVNETKVGRSKQARANWTRLLERYPNSAFASDALFFRAMEEVKAKEFRAVITSLRELIKRFPDYKKLSESYYWLGMASKAISDIPEAEINFREALKHDPNPEFAREIKLELAFILKERGKEKESAILLAELLDTKIVDRLTPNRLAWTAEALLTVSNAPLALKAAEILEKRNADATWNQISAHLVGEAQLCLGRKDAAAAAWSRALEAKAQTSAGAMAALRLGVFEMETGKFSKAHEHLSDAVNRASSSEMVAIRLRAYASLAKNEENRGDMDAALKYHMVVGTLFDEPVLVPKSLKAAAQILRAQGKGDESKALLDEMAKRYPNAVDKEVK
ncbi:MAG: tetratricopeptide repeat protein [Kiritimatiellae bacterium]|nr:tetratricopeptide repeat protein [Kiritimatiellia bacterium]